MSKKELIMILFEIISNYNCLEDSDITFYYDDKRIFNENDEIKEEVVNIDDYLEYFEKDDYYIYMTFEGVFYDVINYCGNSSCYCEFAEFLAEKNYYFELGDYWNMMIIPV